ncbi:RNAse E [Novosphingobium aromaticivorans DSM 12444]|uniref:Ribonuclease E n=1 Tax=Novosphingobium aromaticivorans (strain ATCC 700278 / DSM 12444 / CCUG 56034 / CIP 105152 / NBRC 16084 / F199) TaxID=279238 RepID=Q2G5W8_NOVAD|nr:ribonuclease E/G [Novosphingobium aromaticivorans]ABD26755.1 RNAse E [Novosphingobium aromaticivorans DSM 12444]SCY41217.1 RNAse E [Novosphingobium aromaticivorans]
MTTRMLIDARHQEETRVAVLKGNRIEEFDFESADHKQIKGNIYLAKVTRVEPSLQAAFVDFGGNRHGFLAFSEIHPDYYQIPKEDREALLAEEAAHAEEEAALRAAEDGDDEDYADGEGYDSDEGVTEVDTSEKDQVATIEGGVVENGFDHEGEEGEDAEASEDGEGESEDNGRRRGRQQGRRRQGRSQGKEADELRAKRMALRRRYKIQDVIQRRQVLLVQVVKEERGNKGAALTTYLSLAGRYCVLMPNSSHGGGISRKINSASDRKRLKTIISELELPRSMSCIVRTAGLQRTKPEIKRDFDYLARLWDEIRERTMKSVAPALIHSDSDLIKRAIRDIYNRDIEEVVVEGEHGYRAAKDFMKLLMPSHAKRVKAYADPVPLFQRYGAEDQLTAMYDPVVQLKSGGYLVINPTEALVSIDINSGRSTKEHGIEQTAVATNLEAAREIARQLRLRDMAGLVVIDFIDMEYGSNIRKVEKAMKDALKNDRARIQVGRISGFGLMEMSRQRLRTGVLEATTRACPHCDGSGLVRTASSAGLSALRLIEDEAAKGKGNVVTLYASQEAAVYVLNAKRADLAEIEERYGVTVEVIPEGENEGAKMRVASRGPKPEFVPRFEPIVEPEEDDVVEDAYEDEEEVEERAPRGNRAAEGDEGERSDGRRKRRKRRRGRNRDRREDGTDGEVETSLDDAEADTDADAEGDEAEGNEAATSDENADENDRGPRKRRRRGRRRRGGRENGENGADQSGHDEAEGDDAGAAEAVAEAAEAPAAEEAPAAAEPAVEPVVEEAPAKPKRTRKKKVEAAPAPEAEAEAAPAAPEAAEPAAAEPVAEEAPAKPKRTRKKKVEAAPAPEAEAETEAEAAEPAAAAAEEAPAKPKRVRKKKVEAVASDAAPAETVTAEAPVAAQTAAEEAATEGEAGDQTPRRGWWQRTFGA